MDEQQIKKYFLGKLSEAESERFEEEIAASAELTETAQIVESELVDDYLRGNLPASERELFEAVYLITDARREKLRTAKSLWKIAAEREEITATETRISFWQTLFARRAAFAAVAILVFGAVIFFWLKSNQKEEIAQQQNTNQTPAPIAENRNIQPSENPSKNTPPNNQKSNAASDSNKNISPTPEEKTSPTPKPSEQPAPIFAAFTLLPGTLRDGGEQFIKLAPNTQKVNLRLGLPKDANKYQTYNATVRTADGETVATFSNLKSLNLELPAAKLENRTYIIFIEGKNAQNPAESITEYTFRVRR